MVFNCKQIGENHSRQKNNYFLKVDVKSKEKEGKVYEEIFNLENDLHWYYQLPKVRQKLLINHVKFSTGSSK